MKTWLRRAVVSMHAVLILLALPIGYRRRSLPDLLRRLERQRTLCDLPAAQVAGIVRRLSTLRIFRNRLFPRVCLRRALTSFALLSGGPSSPRFVIGVRPASEGVNAHSWIEIDGHPLQELRPLETFRIVYSYPGKSVQGLPNSDDDPMIARVLDGLGRPGSDESP
jgi:hypothetical protein